MKKRISLSSLALILLFAVLLTVMSSCVIVDSNLRDEYGNNIDNSGIASDKPNKLDTIINLFKTYSYYEIDEEVLCDALVGGMGYAIGDRYADYYDAEEFALMTAENQGETQGIGVTVIENADYKCIEIISVLPNSPAIAAGVEPGDLIVYIGTGENKESVAELGYEGALKKLQGVKGTVCEFTVARGEGYAEEVEFSIMRDVFTSESVTYHVCETDAKVGIIKIIQFDLTTPLQFCTAMDSLIADGVEYFIFDVRYNPGGDLASITAVLSYMLNENDILIKTRDRAGTEVVTKVGPVQYKANDPYSSCNIEKAEIAKYREKVKGKSAVLTNGSTASAAELFTCALLDYEISEIVGTTTYGKGSMQSIFALAYYGFDGAVKMTTKKYFPPISDGYDGIGIKPDLEVELDKALENKNIYKITDAEDNQLQAAIALIGK
ncbi:MAG: PDZ domain-containing protein [Clostridia bacterium]|nr:PDZ domain-containing protein [Clostridia bacterium]